ncbi:hypothetical protein GCM10028771_05800 [Nocardioides marmoraquaticus]
MTNVETSTTSSDISSRLTKNTTMGQEPPDSGPRDDGAVVTASNIPRGGPWREAGAHHVGVRWRERQPSGAGHRREAQLSGASQSQNP